MTCRTLFWEERLSDGGVNCDKWTLEPYDESELTQALAQRGYRRDDFDDKLLPLLTKPRYLDLTAKLRNRFSEEGDVTVERLVYEDWRDQFSRKRGCGEFLTHDDFQELISSLSSRWLDRGVLKRMDVHTELEQYGDGKALLNELTAGRVLRKEGSRWLVKPRYLILGLGLLLADEVKEATGDGEAAMDELISARLEPHRDMDMKVSICGMAVLHTLYCDDYPNVGRLALFRAWIRGHNIHPEDWRRVPAYLPLRPEVYLRMTEYLWGTAGENREAQDVLHGRISAFRQGSEGTGCSRPCFRALDGFCASGWPSWSVRQRGKPAPERPRYSAGCSGYR